MGNNQDQKRVLIFSTAYLPLIGGAEIAVKEITDRLPNWHFDMITAKIQPGLAKQEKVGNITVYRVGFGCVFDKFLLPVLGLWEARKLEKKNNYDLIWSIMASQASVGASFFKILYPSKKLLLTLQEGDLEAHLERYVLNNKFLYNFLIKPWHLSSFKQADYIQAISYFLAERAKNNGYTGAVEVVPNGVDAEIYRRSSEREVQELKNQLKIQDEEKVIFTASRLVKKNGVDDLIKAGQYLDFPFKILIVGDGEDKKKLERLVTQLNLVGKVIFLGHIKHDKLPKYFSIADVFVRASLSEGLGISFLEAMAMGLPIIATPVGGIPEFLKDGETGFFCKIRNPQSIAGKIKLMIFSDRDKMIQISQKLIKEKYTWNIISEKMKVIFNRLTR